MDENKQIKKDESQQKAVFEDKKTQEELNKPLSDPSGNSAEEKEFLEMVISFVKEGKIDLFKPGSLLNSDYYNTLSEEKQGQADLEATNLLASLREIKDLYDAGYQETFQMQNLVQRVKNTKERLEDEGGDLFII